MIAIDKSGTVSEAAVHLRLTQSAVSKRVQALETEVGYQVVERDGRRLRLTSAGIDLLSRAKPLLVEIEGLKFSNKLHEIRVFSIGISDSIASSWGPAVLRRAINLMPDLKLEVHVHRSTLVIENVKLGRYDLGLVTGHSPVGGLISTTLGTEEMVLLGKRKRSENKPVLTIETASATWREIGAAATTHPQFQDKRFEYVESFAAAAQMAREGFGQALVPTGMASLRV
ncbi:MAG: LysR family transcriptional regulator [Bdellovibrionales bacterium]|nr:LysR family transcriptional regulator [Bdellovibrionales bacterium]